MSVASLKLFRRLAFRLVEPSVIALLTVCSLDAMADGPNSLDKRLRKALAKADVKAIEVVEAPSPELFALGQALFFDRILSGNKDTSCATCHHPLLGTGDGLSLPVGTGPDFAGSIGVDRLLGEGREFIPRNAPEVFNRGDAGWRTQFWDGRVASEVYGFDSPAGDALPTGLLDNVLSVQAMFPVTSRDEMRGSSADVAHGNEIAAVPDDDLPGIWHALMERLRDIDAYQLMFLNAYGLTADQLDFDAAAKAIAAFEAAAYGYSDSPFDQYLRGDDSALSRSQKRGAILFYGKAKCVNCHSGTLLTDQEFHNLGVPQLGPGKDPDTGLDLGRFAESGDPRDLFRFRTPPLRNVAATGPWMHNGTYGDLRDAVRHHLNPLWSLIRYDVDEQLVQAELAETLRIYPAYIFGPRDIRPTWLRSREQNDLLSFLDALTAPDLDQRLADTIPDSVPSGLTVEPFIEGP